MQSESILFTRHCYTVVSLCLYGWLFGWQINDNLECRLYFCLTADDPGGVLLLLCWNGPLHLLLQIWPHRAGLLILLPPGVGCRHHLIRKTFFDHFWGPFLFKGLNMSIALAVEKAEYKLSTFCIAIGYVVIRVVLIF